MKMLLPIVALAFASVVTSVAHAEDVTVDVEIKSIDMVARTITVVLEGETKELELSGKAVVTVKGTPSQAAAILPGDKAKIVYHKDLEVVTKIEAEGSVQGGWRYHDIYGKGIDPQRAFVIGRDGRLAMQGTVGGFCLATMTPHSEYTLKMEFQFLLDQFKGGPFMAVASTLPNPKATDWTQQIPHGIEIKLHPDRIGELYLPKDFKVELPLGQLRDDRRIVPLRSVDVKAKEWNTLEVVVDRHRNITIKVNGTTVNAVAKAETTIGHIILMPQNAEMHVRNAVLIEDEQEKPLSFDSIVTE
ncbi:MAG: family 16 glycoside hydrolase [Planctomycetaceae bacterium]